ncbi:Mitochondrial RNA-splicing protein MRS1 [Nakaseomyces bracarensis]|uniref:Mitochondrial RNA-splicing protein MRS1 n=1 Tax=Nakaseomyces bracarensis TaxID=273131 RepID=A0ABR4NR62_9SACH
MYSGSVARAVLGELKNETLKTVSVLIGAKVGLRKSDRVTNICAQLELLHGLQRRISGQERLVVTAIDAGVSNFAYCSFSIENQRRPVLLGWDKYQLEEKFMCSNEKLPLNPTNFTVLSQRICDHLLTLPYDSDLFAIERQRTRTVSSKFVLEPVLRSNILEYLLFSHLVGQSKAKGFSVLSSDPQKMVNYWIESAKADAKLTEKIEDKTSKRFRIKLVQDIILGALHNRPDRIIDIPETFQERFNEKKSRSLKLHHLIASDNYVMGAKKEDDLADSFLHSLIWFEWLKNYKVILDKIENGKASFLKV